MRVEPGVGLEVEHDGPLAPAEQLPRVRVAAVGREPAHAAHAVAGRRFDLDHVGAEVGEVTGPRPGPANTVAMSMTRNPLSASIA